MAQVLEENIQPILILTKSDLGFSRPQVNESLKHIASRVPVFFTSIFSPQTIQAVQKLIGPGETVVFIGSSGVGKSSLINALCERTVLLTSETSKSTGKGRHTSTRREMVLMNGSGILIDTPGVREFGLALDNPEVLSDVFDVSDFAVSCRFDDCAHVNEPGCAVIRAVNDGHLELKSTRVILSYERNLGIFLLPNMKNAKGISLFRKLESRLSESKNVDASYFMQVLNLMVEHLQYLRY